MAMTVKHRKRAVITTLAAAVLSMCATPAPEAVAFGGFEGGAPCDDYPGGDGQGATGGTNNEVCQGSGVIVLGPQVGQVATVIGPTIIGPSTVGVVNTSAGGIAGNTGSNTTLL